MRQEWISYSLIYHQYLLFTHTCITLTGDILAIINITRNLVLSDLLFFRHINILYCNRGCLFIHSYSLQEECHKPVKSSLAVYKIIGNALFIYASHSLRLWSLHLKRARFQLIYQRKKIRFLSQAKETSFWEPLFYRRFFRQKWLWHFMKFLNIYSRYMYYTLFYFIHYAHLKKWNKFETVLLTNTK